VSNSKDSKIPIGMKTKAFVLGNIGLVISIVAIITGIWVFSLPFLLKNITHLRILCVIILVWNFINNVTHVVQEKKSKDIHTIQTEMLIERMAQLAQENEELKK
jgi:hypothetical protein